MVSTSRTVEMCRKGSGNKVCSMAGVSRSGRPKMTARRASGKVMSGRGMVGTCMKMDVLKKDILYVIN